MPDGRAPAGKVRVKDPSGDCREVPVEIAAVGVEVDAGRLEVVVLWTEAVIEAGMAAVDVDTGELHAVMLSMMPRTRVKMIARRKLLLKP